MNKMRDKTHIILIVLVIAFLGTIVFEWGMNYLGLRGGDRTEFGSINGQEIDQKLFNEQVEQTVAQQKKQTGADPDEQMMQMIKDQVWDQLVTQTLVKQEIEKMGIKVTDAEIKNWVYNSPETLPDPIKQNFIDSTGQFNMGLYQQVLSTKTPEIQKFWLQVESYLREMLLNQKLQSVITGAVRVNESDVMQKFKDDNIKASFSYVFLPVTSVQDATITVTDEEVKAYFEKNKEDYKQEESAKMKYVMFSDSPTKEDTTATIKELEAYRKQMLKLSVNDSDLIKLVNDNSIQKYTGSFLKPNEVSSEVANFLFNAKPDSVSNVIKASDGFSVVKFFESKEGDQTTVHASHILINFGTDSTAAKTKALNILNQIKAGGDFSVLASQMSDDPGSKVKGGDLGWFTKGAMVKEFEDACMNGSVGQVVGPIKSQFGYHIIKILGKEKKEFKAAIIKKTVTTSARTKDIIRKRAEDFVFVSRKGNFEEEAKKNNFTVTDIPSVTKTGFIPGVGQNKSVTKFAFSEKNGSISDPIKIQGGYAVYLLVDKIPAGYMQFLTIKDNMLKPKLMVEKKLDVIAGQMKELRSKITTDINIVTSLNKTIEVKAVDTMSVGKPDANIGADNDFNSVVFKMQNGQISEPIRTQRGFFIVQMKNITPFDQNLYNNESGKIRDGILAQKKQSLVQDWLADLKEKAVIVDNRDKFYR